MDDKTFTGAINRQVANTLIQLKKAGWIKRQGLKVAALASAAVTGFLAGRDLDAELTATLAAGAGALVLVVWSTVWSWIDVRTSAMETTKALNTDAPVTKSEVQATVMDITKKDS